MCEAHDAVLLAVPCGCPLGVRFCSLNNSSKTERTDTKKKCAKHTMRSHWLYLTPYRNKLKRQEHVKKCAKHTLRFHWLCLAPLGFLKSNNTK